jgi:hypothetical protein
MFALDRETATIVAVVVCIAATVYLYRELKKTKDDFASALTEKQRPIIYTNPPMAAVPEPEEDDSARPPAPVPVKAAVTRKRVTIAEPESAE